MDPFVLQHAARRRIPLLIALAVLAVIATAAAMGCVLWGGSWAVWAWMTTRWGVTMVPPSPLVFADRFPLVVETCFLFSGALVLWGLLYKIFDLSSGDVLMEQLGATRVERAKLTDSDEDVARLRLYNVCEEMAIAAGLDLPSVWVMESVSGINALAAGAEPSAAAVCVTAGALRYLTRDELQGVVAHEFSHILNGDMRLNFRLTAFVAGISLVSRTGKGLLSVLEPRGADEDDSLTVRRGGHGGLPLPLPILVVYILVGVALYLVGALGALFARLVQGAVSRDREFLADAAAAQFTRNPESLANALRLASLAHAGAMGARYGVWRADVAHLMFTATGFELWTTHPPIGERIRRLSPRGIGADETLKRRVQEIRAARQRKVRELDAKIRVNLKQQKARQAAMQTFLSPSLPPDLLAGSRNVHTAGLLLKELLGEPGTFDVRGYAASLRRTLAFRCVNTLRDGLSPEARRQWAEIVWDIAVRDGQLDSFEIVVCAAARRHLLGPVSVKTVSTMKLRSVAAAVIATVAAFGRHPESGYRIAWRKLSLFGPPVEPMPEPIAAAEDFLNALEQLVALAPLAKKEFLFALRDTAAEDGVIQQEESDYIAAVADAIGAYGWLQSQSSAS